MLGDKDATATIAVRNLDTARKFKARGVTFEHYDMPELKRVGDVYVGGNMKVAWFKDPDGNILNIFSG